MGCFQSKISKNTEIKHKPLYDCNYKNTEKFTFNEMLFFAKVVKVYDGDTCTVVFFFNGDNYRFNIRMSGYDSPELRSKDPVEKKYAKMSQKILSDLILNKKVILYCKDFDKYGRIMGVIELNGQNINQHMLTYGHCRIYNGGHKEPWIFE